MQKYIAHKFIFCTPAKRLVSVLLATAFLTTNIPQGFAFNVSRDTLAPKSGFKLVERERERPAAELESQKPDTECTLYKVTKPESFAATAVKESLSDTLGDPSGIAERLPHSESVITQDTKDFTTYFLGGVEAAITQNHAYAYDFPQFYKQLCEYSPQKIAERRGQLEKLLKELKKTNAGIKAEYDIGIVQAGNDKAYIDGILDNFELMISGLEKILSGETKTSVGAFDLSLAVESNVDVFIKEAEELVQLARAGQPVPDERVKAAGQARDFLYLVPGQKEHLLKIKAAIGKLKRDAPGLQGLLPALKVYLEQEQAARKEIEQCIAAAFSMSIDSRPRERTSYRLTLVLLDRSPRLFMSSVTGTDMIIGINRALFEVSDEHVRKALLGSGIYYEMCKMLQKKDEKNLKDFQELLNMSMRHLNYVLGVAGKSPAAFADRLKNARIIDDTTVDLFLSMMLARHVTYSYQIADRKMIKELEEKHRRYVKNPDFQRAFDQIAPAAAEKEREKGKDVQERKERDAQKEMILNALDRHFFAKLPAPSVASGEGTGQDAAVAAVQAAGPQVSGAASVGADSGPRQIFNSVMKKEFFSAIPVRGTDAADIDRIPMTTFTISSDDAGAGDLLEGVKESIKNNALSPSIIDGYKRLVLRYSPEYVQRESKMLRKVAKEVRGHARSLKQTAHKYDPEEVSDHIAALKDFALHIDAVIDKKTPTGSDSEEIVVRIENDADPFLHVLESAVAQAAQQTMDPELRERIGKQPDCIALTPAQESRMEKIDKANAAHKDKTATGKAVDDATTRLSRRTLFNEHLLRQLVMRPFTIVLSFLPPGRTQYAITFAFVDRSERLFTPVVRGNDLILYINRAVYDIADTNVSRIFVTTGLFHEILRFLRKVSPDDHAVMDQLAAHDLDLLDEQLRNARIGIKDYYDALIRSGVVDVPSVEFFVGSLLRSRYMSAAMSGDRAAADAYADLMNQFQTPEFREANQRCIDLAALVIAAHRSELPAGLGLDQIRDRRVQDEIAMKGMVRGIEVLINRGVSRHLYGIPPLEISGGIAAGEPPAETIQPETVKTDVPATETPAVGEFAALPAAEQAEAPQAAAKSRPADIEAKPVIDPVVERCKKVADKLKEYEEALRLLLRQPAAGELTIGKIVSKPQKGSPRIVVQITNDSVMPAAGQYLLLRSKLFKADVVFPDRREVALLKVEAEGAQINEGTVLRLGLKGEDVRPIERQIGQIQAIRQRLKDRTTGNFVLDRISGILQIPIPSDSPAAQIPAADFLSPLNDSQMTAVRKSLGQSEVVYIDGAYKTGKTMALAEIIHRSFKLNSKVLFISPVKPDSDPYLKKVKERVGEDHFYEYPRIAKDEQGCVECITVQDFRASEGKGIGTYDTVIVDDCPRDVMIEALNHIRAGGKAIFARSEKGSPLFGFNAEETAYLRDAHKKSVQAALDEPGDHLTLREKLHQVPVLIALSDLIAGQSDGTGVKSSQVKSFQLRVGEVHGEDAVNAFLREIVKQLREYRDKGIPPNYITIVVPDRLQGEYLENLLRIQHLRTFLGIKDDGLMPRITTFSEGMGAQNKAVILALVFCPPREAIDFIKSHGRLLPAESLTILYDPGSLSGEDEKGFYRRVTDFYAGVAAAGQRKPADLPKDIARVATERTITPAALAVEPGSMYFSPVALKVSEGTPKPFIFVKHAVAEGNPEYIVTAKVSGEKSLEVKWGNELEETVKSMGISSKEIQDLVQSVLLMTGGDEHKIPRSINLALLDRSSHLAEYFPRTHTVGLNRVFDNFSGWARKAFFMAALYDILSQILNPDMPPAGSLGRLGSFLFDVMRDNKISLDELTREMKKGVKPEAALPLFDVVRREETRGVRAADEQLKLELAPPAGKYDQIFNSYLDACVRQGLITEVQRKIIQEIVSADNPDAGWDIEGIKQLVKFVNDPHIRHFSKIYGPGGWPIKMLPRYELDLVREFKEARNIGALLKKVPFDEMYYDLRVAVNAETEKSLKDKADSAAGVIQGALTELFHARCMKISEKKPVSGFSLPLGRLGSEWTEVDTILSPDEGIVESKSRGDFYVKEKTGVRETIDSIISGKLQKLQDSVANGHLAFLRKKKVTFTFNRRVLNIIAKQIVERMKQDDPLADIYIDFTNKLPPRDLGTDLEASLRGIRKNEGLQTVTVNADDMITCIKNRYKNHSSGWEVDIKLFPNVVFLRDDISPAEYEKGKRRILASDDTMQNVLKEYDRKIARLFGLQESQIGTLPATLEYDEAKIAEAVDTYGVSILTVDAPGKELEEAAKWLSQRDLLKTDGYLKVVQDIQDALKPFKLNMAWKEYFNDPAQNPKRKLMEYIATAKPALADILQMLGRVKDAVAAEQAGNGLTAQIEFICDSSIDAPLVKKMEGGKQIVQINIPQILGKEDQLVSFLTRPAEIAKAEYLQIKDPKFYDSHSKKIGADGILKAVEFSNADEVYRFGTGLAHVPVMLEVSGTKIEVIVEKELFEKMPNMADLLGQTLKAALDRSGGDIKNLPLNPQGNPFLVLSLLDRSSHVAEDHIANGFIGINRIIFEIDGVLLQQLLLRIAVFHEMSHEAAEKIPREQLAAFEEAQLVRDARYAAAVMQNTGLQVKDLSSVLQRCFAPAAEPFMRKVTTFAISGQRSHISTFWQRARDFGLFKLLLISVSPLVSLVYIYATAVGAPEGTVPVQTDMAVVVPGTGEVRISRAAATGEAALQRKEPSDLDRLTDEQFIQEIAAREAGYFDEAHLPGNMSWDHIQLLVEDEFGQPNSPPAGLRSTVGKVSDYTAASKESLHIAYLLNLITEKPALKDTKLTASDAEKKALAEWKADDTAQNVAKLRLIEKLKTHLTYGKLMPWVSILPDGTLRPTTDFIPALDNGQTTWSLIAVIGALQDNKDPLSVETVKLAGDVLKLHNYAPFLNKKSGLLRAEVNNDLSERGGYELNDMYEGTMAVLYAVLTGQVPESAWDNIGIAAVPYTTQEGETIDVLQGYRGSMHELWALGWIPYMESPLAPVIKNFAYAHMDAARKNGLPGVGATCYTSKGYQQIGPLSLASHPGDREDVATAYATAMLMLVDRDAGLSWFRNLYGYPGMAGNHGIIESVTPEGYANILSTDSKGLVLLSLCGGLQDEVKAYLKSHTVPGTKVKMYDKLMELLARKYQQLMDARKGAPLRTSTKPYPKPPDAPFKVTLAAEPVVPPEYDVTGVLKFEHHHGLNIAEPWQNPAGGITISYNIPPEDAKLPSDDAKKYAWKGTFVPPVNISKMNYLSVTVPADTPRYVFDIELKNSIRDFILAHAVVDTTATEDVVMSPDGKWKTIVCRIRPGKATKLNEFDYFSVAIDNPTFRNIPMTGKFDISAVKLTQANPITGALPAPVSEKIEIPGGDNIFPYITWPHGGLEIVKDKESETVVFTDRMIGDGKWKGGYVAPPVNLSEKYAGGHINMVVRNLTLNAAAFEFELKSDTKNLLGGKYHVEIPVNAEWQVIQVPLPADKDMIANYLAISDVVGKFELGAITFDKAPAGPPSIVAPVKAEYMQVKAPYYSEKSMKNGKEVSVRTPGHAYAYVASIPHMPLAVNVRGTDIDVIVDKALFVAIPNMADILGQALKEALDRTGGSLDNLPRNAKGKPFLSLLLLDTSSHLFEDHIGNGFIGINRALLEIRKKNEDVFKVLLGIGLFHELSHEVAKAEGVAFEKAQMIRDAEYGFGLLRTAEIGLEIFEPVLKEMFTPAIAVFIDALNVEALTPAPAVVTAKEMEPLYAPIETPRRSVSGEAAAAAIVGDDA